MAKKIVCKDEHRGCDHYSDSVLKNDHVIYCPKCKGPLKEFLAPYMYHRRVGYNPHLHFFKCEKCHYSNESKVRIKFLLIFFPMVILILLGLALLSGQFGSSAIQKVIGGIVSLLAFTTIIILKRTLPKTK